MYNLFTNSERNTRSYKIGVLNTKRTFSTTRRLNLGPVRPEHIRPVIGPTKELAEEAIKQTIKETFEETGITLTREKAALITETRDLFNITD